MTKRWKAASLTRSLGTPGYLLDGNGHGLTAIDFVMDHYDLQSTKLKVECLEHDMDLVIESLANVSSELAKQKFVHYMHTITLELQKKIAFDVGLPGLAIDDLLRAESAMTKEQKDAFSEYKQSLDLNRFKNLLVDVKQYRDHADAYLGQTGSTFPPLNPVEVEKLVERTKAGGITRAAIAISQKKCPELWSKTEDRNDGVIFI